MHILAIDVGTSAIKAAVLDTADASASGPLARVEVALDHPTPEAAELPAERLWQAVSGAGKQACRGQPNVEAVGLTVQTPGLVLLDDADRPAGPIWTHLDRRSRPAARQVWAAVGEEFLATVGNRPLPGGISVLAWRQQLTGDPYLVHQVKSYLHINGWLALRLTGQRAFDPANASFSGLWNTAGDQAWSPRWCEYFEVDPSWLPPVLGGDATVGTVRAEAAAELGVPAGVPLKLGTCDTSSAILAAGLERGDLLHSIGTTQVLAMRTDKPRPSPRYLTRRLGVGPDFVQVAHNAVGAVALDWLRQLCFREQAADEFYAHTVPQALAHPTKVTLDPPVLGGDRLEIDARRAAFRDLTLATDRLDLLAAVLQAMVRCHRQALADLGLAAMPRRVFLSGREAELVRRLIPEYAAANITVLEEGALRGVAQLFRTY
jgi:xylulokinase